MPIAKSVFLFLALNSMLAVSSPAQSLGEAARQQRQNHPTSTLASHKQITNDDLPSLSTQNAQSTGHAEKPASADVAKGKPAPSEPKTFEEWTKAGEEWKKKISEQTKKVQQMQAYVVKVRSSSHFASQNKDYDAATINLLEMEKLHDADRVEKQIDAENAALQQMRDAAQAAGYDSSISGATGDSEKQEGGSGPIQD